jgi:hypothetical protein
LADARKVAGSTDMGRQENMGTTNQKIQITGKVVNTNKKKHVPQHT